MPALIVRNGTSSSITYQLGGTEMLHVESVSADVTANAAAGAFFADVTFFDPSGSLIARARSSGSLTIGPTWLVTWAPDLPDTAEIGNASFTTVITTGLTNTIVPPNGSIVVSVTDPAAIVTQARLWVDTVAPVAGDVGDEVIDVGRWAFVPGPGS